MGLVVQLFENQGSEPDRFATRVPISGTFERPETNGWAAVGGVLSNAFIEALRRGFQDHGEWSRASDLEDD